MTQLAIELGVTTETITGWIAEGKDIPHYQLGPGPDQIRFRHRDIAPLFAEHGVEEAAEPVDAQV